MRQIWSPDSFDEELSEFTQVRVNLDWVQSTDFSAELFCFELGKENWWGSFGRFPTRSLIFLKYICNILYYFCCCKIFLLGLSFGDGWFQPCARQTGRNIFWKCLQTIALASSIPFLENSTVTQTYLLLHFPLLLAPSIKSPKERDKGGKLTI